MNPVLLAVLAAVGLVAALVLLAVAIARPAVAVGLWAAVVVSNASSVIGPVGPISLYTAGVGLLVVTALIGLVRGTVRFRWTPVYLLPLVWLVTRAISIPTAVDPNAAWSTTVSEVKELVAFVLAILLLTSLRSLRPVVVTAVAVVAVLCGLSLVQEFVLHDTSTFAGFSNVPLGADIGSDTSRHSGPEIDVNFWSRTILLWFPAALALLAERTSGRLARGLWILAAVVLFGGQYLTQSRGGLLSMAVGALAWLRVSGIRARRQLAIVAVGVALVLVTPGAVSRLDTLTLASTSGFGVVDQSLTDRAAVQKVGLAMALDHPILGVGAGNFILVEPQYRRQTASTLSQPLAPHDIYLEMGAEGGIVGLLGWLVLLGGAVAIALRIRLRWAHAADPPDAPGDGALIRTLSSGLFAGLVGWAVASIFLHLSDLPILMLFLAVLGALDVHQRGEPVAEPIERPVTPTAQRARVAALTLAVALAVAAGWFFGPVDWTASEDVVVAPSSVSTSSLYSREVITRPQVLASVAAVLTSPQLLQLAADDADLKNLSPLNPLVSASRTPGTLAVTLHVRTQDETASRALLPALTARAGAYIDEQHALFVLTEPDPRVTVTSARGWTPLPLVVLAAGAALVLAGRRGRVLPQPAPAMAVPA